MSTSGYLLNDAHDFSGVPSITGVLKIMQNNDSKLRKMHFKSLFLYSPHFLIDFF